MRADRWNLLLKIFPATCLIFSALFTFATDQKNGDQQKAQKRLDRISAMAVDTTARSIINATMADAVLAKPIELMRQRHAMNLNYGSLFIAHQLTAGGTQMLDIALELQTGKDIVRIANERGANWKRIADSASKLNEKIDDNVYRHFLRTGADKHAAPPDQYDADRDIVRADLNFTPDEIASARADYNFWRNRGSAPRTGRLDSQSEGALGSSADIYKGGQHPHPVP